MISMVTMAGMCGSGCGTTRDRNGKRLADGMATKRGKTAGGKEDDEVRRRAVVETVREVSAPTAMQHVLDTSELLELILVHVDMQTLLTSAQRTSRTWHALIATSPPLQRRLFFLPERRRPPDQNTSNPDDPTTAVTEPELRRAREEHRVDNPLLVAHFGPFFGDAVDPLQLVPAAGEVTLEEALWELDEEIAVPSARTVFRGLPLHRLHVETGCGDSAYRREGASWKRMLTSQPAVTRVGFLRHPGTRNDPEMQVFEPQALPHERNTGDRCSSPSSSSSSSSAESSRVSDGSSTSSSSSSPPSSACTPEPEHEHDHGLRMGHLYHEVLTRVRWADIAKFQVLAYAQALPRDEFVRRATLPRPWSAVWGDEDASGPGSAAGSTAAGDGAGKAVGRAALREMHDAGAEVVVLSYRSASSCFMDTWDLGIKFWGECAAGK